MEKRAEALEFEYEMMSLIRRNELSIYEVREATGKILDFMEKNLFMPRTWVGVPERDEKPTDEA